MRTLFALVAFSTLAAAQPYAISTVAGGGPGAGEAGNAVALYAPIGMATDSSGNLYVLPSHSEVIPSSDVYIHNAAGAVTRHLQTPILLPSPHPVVDSTGSLYIADGISGSKVWRIALATGQATVVAGSGTEGYAGDGGPAVAAKLNAPTALAMDAAGNLYIADTVNNCIRKVTPGGTISTVAGNAAYGYLGDNGPAGSAQLAQPQGIAADSAGNLYIADSANNVIRKVAASTGVITTIAGDGTALMGGDGGPATQAQINYPTQVALDASGNLYILDSGNLRIRKLVLGTGIISTVAGTGAAGYAGDGGAASKAVLNSPSDITTDAAGNVYVVDTDSNRIRKITVATGIIASLIGNGQASYGGDGGAATSAQFNFPGDVVVDASGNIYIADNENFRVRKVAAKTGLITTYAGSGVQGYAGDGGQATAAQIDEIGALALDTAGNLYIADMGNNAIRKVNASTGVITTIAGNGTQGYSGDGSAATKASLYAPTGVAVDSAGNVYIADSGSNTVRKVTAASGVISTVAGSGTGGFGGDGGPATSAQMGAYAVAVDTAGNLYVTDVASSRVRKITASTGIISTIAGTGTEGYSGDGGPATAAALSQPGDVSVDSAGNVYIADMGNNRIRKITAGTGIINTIAGTGTAAFSGDGGLGTSATLNQPGGICLDASNAVYIADTNNLRIRKLANSLTPSITAGGIGPVYSSATTIQPGSWVSIYGINLAPDTYIWNNDFPKSLGGVTVTINGKPAYLWFVSPTQINLQAPDDTATGTVNVTVTNPNGTTTATVTLAAESPSFSLLDAKHVAAIIATPDGSGAYGGGGYDIVGPVGAFVYNTRPVKAGEVLVLYGVGFGPTKPAVPAGSAFAGAAPTTNPVTITIGGVNAQVAFAGITGAGLYQFNIVVPVTNRVGDVAIQATVAGVKTVAGPVVTMQ